MANVPAFLLAASLVIAALLLGGRYEISRGAAPTTTAFVLDRFTGEVRLCHSSGCEVLPKITP